MDYVTRLMRRYRHLVTDPAFRQEQERRKAVKLERFIRRLLEWDGVSEELPSDRFGGPTPSGGAPAFTHAYSG